MTVSDIASNRLHNQHLTSPDFDTAKEVVNHLGAVQAQDFPAAKWALTLRMKSATESMVEQEFNSGSFVRTHIMRPTWHFVMPKDLRWMQQLTSPYVKKLLSHYDRKLEITPDLIKKSQRIIESQLKNKNFSTRKHLADALEAHKIPARGQRLGHIVMHSELDSLICSGPRIGKPFGNAQGKQFSYALVDEVIPATKPLSREESMARLAKMYFSSHGPAQTKDFSWWSGLPMKEATFALELISKDLTSEIFEDKTYWFYPQNIVRAPKEPLAFLLSIFDEYTIAYKDRSALGGERYVEQFITMGNALTAVIILNGKVIGTWKRVIKKNIVEIRLSFLRTLTKSENAAVEKAAHQYGEYIQLPITITIN